MLFFDLRRNQRLAARRSPMFDKNRFARLLMGFMVAFWAAYLLFFGVMIALAFREGISHLEPYHVLNKGLLIFLVIDFLIRLLMSTPVQDIRPLLLLPVSRKRVMSCLLIESALDSYNFFFLFFFVPFALLTVTRFYGLTGVLSYAVGIWLLMVFNGFWSMLIRVLKRQRFAWIFLLVPVYGLLALLEFLPDKGWVTTASMYLGEGYIRGNVWFFLGTLAAIFLMGWVNYIVQIRLIHSELSRTEDTQVKHLRRYTFLNRYGRVGEYMQLELKMIFRNKSPRSQFWGFITIMCMFAAFLWFDIYGEGSYMNNFVCLYCYCVLGLITLSQIMAVEGNYIDGLMVHKESLFDLMRAKYYVQCLFLVIPFLFNLIAVGRGTLPLLMPVGYLFFTMGPVFALMMQLAVYNNKTAPLNTGLMGRKQGNSMYQTLLVGTCFTVPLLINKLLTLFLPPTYAYITLGVLGLATVATHKYWIRNIYHRFLHRRYANMEGFRATR